MTAVADQAARDDALDLKRHILAVAPAGSGKTGLLVRRALRALAVCDEPEQVVCITFTRKAAAEIRHRMLDAIARAEQSPPDDAFGAGMHADALAVLRRDRTQGWNLRSNPNRLRATTIDAFNQRLAGSLPMLSGLGGPVTLHQQPRALYERAVLAAFSRLDEAGLPDEDRTALLAIMAWANNRLDLLMSPLADLLSRRDQWLAHAANMRAVPTAEDAAVLQALVGARIAAAAEHFDADTAATVCTCLNAAATEHDSMVWAAGLQWPGTALDALPLWQGVARALLTGDPQSSMSLRKTVNKNHGFPAGCAHKAPFVAVLEELRERLDSEALIADLQEVLLLPAPKYPAAYADLRAQLARVLLLVYAELRVIFGNQGEADFAELAHAAVAAASGEFGADAIARTDAEIRHLLVDEMQDTSAAQLRLLEQLTQNWQPGDGRSLFLVGDPQQSIYGFRNAEVRLFMQLMGAPPRHTDARLGGLPLHVLHLQVNFRSESQLIGWYNQTFSQVFPEQPDADAGVVQATPCAPRLGAGAGGNVRLVAAAEEDGPQAAALIAELLEQGGPETRIGLLAATRPQLQSALDALAAAGLAHEVQARDVRPLADEPAVIDYLHLLRVLRQPQDRLAWLVLLRAPSVGLLWADLLVLSRGRTQHDWPTRLAAFATGDMTLSEDGTTRLNRLMKALAEVETLRADLPAAAESLWHSLGGPACVDDFALQAVQLAMRCVRGQAVGGEIADWPALERALGELYAPARAGRIEATTIHKSKGLQYQHVVLVGCGAGSRGDDKPMLYLHAQRTGTLLAPKPADEDDPGQAIYDLAHRMQGRARKNERLRLLYVAATRAEKTLTLVAAAPWKSDKQGDEYRIRSGSFADVLRHQFQPEFEALPEPEAIPEDAAEEEQPIVARGPAQGVVPPSDVRWLPTEQRTRKPSERTLTPITNADDAGDLLSDGDLYAQLVGTMVHQALERVSVDGLDAWAEVDANRRRAMASGLLRMGMPPEQLDAAVERVATLVSRLLASEAGQWALRDWPWWRNEYPMGGWRDGVWESAVIDRCFEDDDGVLWVIDYKTAAYPIEEPPAAYAERMRAKYAVQIAQYVGLMRVMRPGVEVRGALVLVEVGELVVTEGGVPTAG